MYWLMAKLDGVYSGPCLIWAVGDSKEAVMKFNINNNIS